MNVTSPVKPPGAGKSSFDLIEAERFWREFPLPAGGVIADLGCGRGAYALALAGAAGPETTIYAFDLWEEGIAALTAEAASRGYRHLKAEVADVSRRIPLKDGCVNLALMATVLHDLVEAGTAAGALKEAARVLKPGGVLAIVEFNKAAGPPGPPIHVKMAPAAVAQWVEPYGFQQQHLVAVGPHNYLLLFRKGGVRVTP